MNVFFICKSVKKNRILKHEELHTYEYQSKINYCINKHFVGNNTYSRITAIPLNSEIIEDKIISKKKVYHNLVYFVIQFT